MSNKYNWKEIQEFYDKEGTWRKIVDRFECSNTAVHKAVKRGDLKLRTSSESLRFAYDVLKIKKKPTTQETKDKISKSRIKYLEENPDKVPYVINHSSNMSYPEKLFMDALNLSNIQGWKYNYRNGIYSYDFAFTDIKLDVEIDGGTHTSEKVKKIDERRDIWSKNNEWKVLRFTAKEVKSNIVGCIEMLKKELKKS